MGERVEFSSNSHTCNGYLATPLTGTGPGIVVIQEWWGLVPHIQSIVDRLAAENFLAMAPDLYHGKTTTSPNEAGKLLMELDAERAGHEIVNAGEYLITRPECATKTYGVIGFCMGGALAQYAATLGKNVGGAVSFYGGFKNVPIAWENLNAPLLLIYGGGDQGVPPAGGHELEAKLKSMGKEVDLVIYEGADHAFFNDTRPEVFNPPAATEAWHRTIAFFRKHLK